MSKKKQLLWIGAGDLAQRTLPYLAKNQWQTTAINRRGQATGFHLSIAADITAPEKTDQLPPATHIYYSVTPDGRSPVSYETVYDTGLKNLVKNINRNSLERFVFISSTAVYGANASPQDEQSPLRPSAFNGIAIAKAEQFLRAELGDLLTVIRFTGLYGPDRHYLFNRLQEGKTTVNPALDNYANRIHIDDAARVCAHVLQLEQAANSYLATDHTPLPISKLYAQIAQWLEAPKPILDQNLAYESKHFSNQALLKSGFHFLYPDTLTGYKSFLP